MSKLLYILMLAMLVNCGPFNRASNIYTPDNFLEVINNYLDDREYYTGSREVNYPIDIYFSDLEEPKIGLCITKKYVYLDGKVVYKKEIAIDMKYWLKTTNCKRKLIMYHELGHCDLGLDHVTNKIHIMNSNIGNVAFKFCKDEDKYIKEMFLK